MTNHGFLDDSGRILYNLTDSSTMSEHLTNSAIEAAFRRLGELVAYHREIEILLVGGAAGMVTGVLPAGRTTTDCDVMVYLPEEALAAVETAAGQVAAEMGLASHWLNSDVQLRRDALPDGWHSRRIFVGMYGQVGVYAISRPDLIAMKVLAGRPQDLEDLAAMKPRQDELDLVDTYLSGLHTKGTCREQIEDAKLVLSTLDAHDED